MAKGVRVLVLSALLLGLCACTAHAASPAWKVIGATGPTHLPPAANETQQVSLAPGVGSFTLAFQGESTAAIAADASAAEVEAALNDISTIGGAGASVAVSGTPGGPYTIVFGGSLEGTNVPEIAASSHVAVGAQLSCTGGPAAANRSFEWLADGAPATGAGADSDTYTVDTADAGKALQCRVVTSTATGTPPNGPTGSTQASNPAVPVSVPTDPAPRAPNNIPGPAAPVGGFVAGSKLICATGTWIGVSEPFAYQWYRNGVALVGNGADTSEYTLQAGDLSTAAAFQCAVIGSNADGSVVKVSANRVTAAPAPVPSPAAPATTAAVVPPAATVATTTEGGANGQIAVQVANIGGLASIGTITLTIGPLPPGILTSGFSIGIGWICSGGAGQTTLTCTRTTEVPVENQAQPLLVPISIGPDAAPSSTVPISVEGGGAGVDGGDEYTMPVTVSSVPAEAGVQVLWAGAFDEDGQPSVQAGAHPARAGAFFRVNTILSPSGEIIPAGDARDVVVGLPPGFIGNPLVTPRCPQEERFGNAENGSPACPLTAVVGRAQPNLYTMGGEAPNRPIFNDIPAFGSAAQFTFEFVNAEATILGSLRSDEDFGVTVSAPKIPTLPGRVYGAFSILNGNPPGASGKAFLTNPTNCAEQARSAPITTIAVNTWQQPTIFGERQTEVPPVVGCDELEFGPGFTFQPVQKSAASGTSAEAKLSVDQAGLLDPTKLASPHLKKSVVVLPEGMNLNPAAANGLQACSTAQIGLKGTSFPDPNPIRFNRDPVACPDASKIGTVEVETPLLEAPLSGTVYLAAQDDNPFRSLLAIYLVVEDARTGINLKLPGKVTPDPVTGQLTAEFDHNPQVPFEDLTLSFRGGGPRSTMATPDVCGDYATSGTFTPWSAPESGPPATTTDGFTISSGVGGAGACPRTKAERPFALGFAAGTTNPTAGAHSPITLRITRPDGNQEIDRVTVATPAGLAATLRGVTTCSDAQLAAAMAPGRTGKTEMEAPSCPANSQVGTTTIGAGVGPEPIYVKTGKAYLTGPYKGAQISLTFIVPAVAGPFDLGVQVVRTALRVNPTTAQITAESDPIPQLLKGIPLQIRDIRVDLDRPGFGINPTSCETMAINGQVTGGSGAVSNLSTRFQVGECGSLGFKPKLKLRYKGQTKRGGNPGLRAVLTQPAGQANISRAAVILPKGSFIDNAHINNPCTRAQFAAEACPKASILGTATAWSPLLDEPLTGYVYFRSNGGERELPDVVASLRGQVNVELVGFIDSVVNKKTNTSRVRNTFAIVPDAPVSRFELKMKGGKRGLIENSRNLCLGKNRATVKLNAHNGRRSKTQPVVQTDCKKKKSSKKKGKKKPAK